MKKISTILIGMAIIVSVFAHEYILLASKFVVAKGDTLELHLFVADGFNVQLERPVQTAITKKFEMITGKGATDLLSKANDGALPILEKVVDFDGLGLIHIERDYASITLATDKFLSYLKEDHIENIVVKSNDVKQFQRERYSRYIKCLVQSGKPGADTLYKTIVNQHFEIILLDNPYKLHVGNSLKAQVFFMGRPLANKTITARNRIGSEQCIELTARTDKKGICIFPIKRKGDWFIHATHMIACPDKNDADWESFWASYSFGIGD